MKCLHCKGKCLKKGKTRPGIQKYRCAVCLKYQREEYQRNGSKPAINVQVVMLLKESSGIRSISRVLKISTTTVILIIKREAGKIKKPPLKRNREYEADEMKTYVLRKKNEQWIMYAIDRKSREPVDFRIGRRNKTNLKKTVDTLLLSNARRIYTDRLSIYKSIIPREVHKAVPHNTNHIERLNLNLRTHLKRLTRRTICFSKSTLMLEAVMKIYFWF